MAQYFLVKVRGEKEKGTGAPVSGEQLVAWSHVSQPELTDPQIQAMATAEAAHFGRKTDPAGGHGLTQDGGQAIDEKVAKELLKNSRRILDLDHGKFKTWICWRN